jgi:hypothetical protein
MNANIGAALTRITRLYPFQIGSLALTTVFTGISAMSVYSDKVPAPETYIKATIRADGERAPTSDPKAEIKYRNNGGSPMILKSIKIMTDGKVVDSFSDAIGPTKGKYIICSESSVFLKNGHIDRNIKSVSCTVRPVAEALEGIKKDYCRKLNTIIFLSLSLVQFCLEKRSPNFFSCVVYFRDSLIN